MRIRVVIRYLVLVELLFITTAGIALHGAIPATERAALIALYNATNGDNWVVNKKWKGFHNESDGFSEKGSEGTWYGVSVNSNHVTDIILRLDELEGQLPAQLGNLTHLKTLDLSGNKISGTIPPQLGNLSNLSYLSLINNQLTGGIPSEFGNLSSLYRFDLSYNKLNGSIPAELGNLSNLTFLYLEKNQLTGSIPPELGNLDLQGFLLAHNQLTGSIPPELGNFSNCTSFDLSNNHLTGGIPPELGNLTSTEILFLSANQLTGDIPSTLTNLTQFIPKNFGISLDFNALYAADEAVRNFLFICNLDWEKSQTTAPSNVSATPISDKSIRVTWTPIIYTEETGGYLIYYSNIPGGPYTLAGNTETKSAASFDVTGLGPGRTYYLVVKTQTNPHRSNKNTVVSEASEEVSAATLGSITEKDPPFGSFETPLDGSVVAGSIPVTGWALDDSGVTGISIYREVNGSLFYIGDAVRVEGARPDVAVLYPEYPENTKAGWGYMMLTNYLPNNGNGTFTLYAVAVDTMGKSTTLGTKTITCDNANAVKPFGTLDTPLQGGSAWGATFKNWGWALTPQPNSIPTDGSTINVFVDGVNIGNPVYDLYREDIAGLFPDYANSAGAVGYFNLDTTKYADGVHTISWAVEDDAGNSDGIGSRYFSIQNTGGSSGNLVCPPNPAAPTNSGVSPVISDFMMDESSPVWIKRGYDSQVEPEAIDPAGGMVSITIHELERIEIYLEQKGKTTPDVVYAGYQMIGDQLIPLPVGSTLDRQKGIFYWQPGPGFLGKYRFVLIVEDVDGQRVQKHIQVFINPRQWR